MSGGNKVVLIIFVFSLVVFVVAAVVVVAVVADGSMAIIGVKLFTALVGYNHNIKSK